MILTTNKETLQSRIDASYLEYSVGASEMMQTYLRGCFDGSLIDSNALAVIQLTMELGFIDLAEEMQNDYDVETSGNQN